MWRNIWGEKTQEEILFLEKNRLGVGVWVITIKKDTRSTEKYKQKLWWLRRRFVIKKVRRSRISLEENEEYFQINLGTEEQGKGRCKNFGRRRKC